MMKELATLNYGDNKETDSIRRRKDQITDSTAYHHLPQLSVASARDRNPSLLFCQLAHPAYARFALALAPFLSV